MSRKAKLVSASSSTQIGVKIITLGPTEDKMNGAVTTIVPQFLISKNVNQVQARFPAVA